MFGMLPSMVIFIMNRILQGYVNYKQELLKLKNTKQGLKTCFTETKLTEVCWISHLIKIKKTIICNQ